MPGRNEMKIGLKKINGTALHFIICCYLTNVQKKAILLPLSARIAACKAQIIKLEIYE